MLLPYDLCARLQNGFRARLRQLPIPHTTQNLAITNILLRHGFIQNLSRGSITSSGPSPSSFNTSLPKDRRIWLTLKYRDDLPVLSAAEIISKPSKRVELKPEDIRRICSGQMANFVKPLGMGEVAVVKSTVFGEKKGEGSKVLWLEARDALKRGLGGEILCRMR